MSNLVCDNIRVVWVNVMSSETGYVSSIYHNMTDLVVSFSSGRKLDEISFFGIWLCRQPYLGPQPIGDISLWRFKFPIDFLKALSLSSSETFFHRSSFRSLSYFLWGQKSSLHLSGRISSYSCWKGRLLSDELLALNWCWFLGDWADAAKRLQWTLKPNMCSTSPSALYTSCSRF